jgi:hypothetical protein
MRKRGEESEKRRGGKERKIQRQFEKPEPNQLFSSEFSIAITPLFSSER